MFKGFDNDEDDEYVPRGTFTSAPVAQQPIYISKNSSTLFDQKEQSIVKEEGQSTYSRADWIKFEFMNRIKRIYLVNQQDPSVKIVWTLQKMIELLRSRFSDLDAELKVYEEMTGSHRQLDTNELMKIINLSYIDEEDEEIDIDSNLNLQDALRANTRMRESAFRSEDVPCLKIFVKVNRRIVPIDADKSEQYLAIEDFKNENKDRFSQLVEDKKEAVVVPESSLVGVQKMEEKKAGKNIFGDSDDDEEYVPGQNAQIQTYEVQNHLGIIDHEMKPNDSDEMFGFNQPLSQSNYQPIAQQQNQPVEEEEEYSIFEKISNTKPVQNAQNYYQEESKEDMVMQVDAFLNKNNNADDHFDIDAIQRLMRENKMTLTPDELKRQEEILNEISQNKQKKKEQQMHDEEIARSLNFQEMIRSQQEDQQKSQNNNDQMQGVQESEAISKNTSSGSSSRPLLKFEEVGYKIKMIKDPTLKKSNMFSKILAKLTTSEEKKKPKQMALAVNGASINVAGKPGKQVNLEWTLKNESDSKWPKKGILLVNQRDKEAYIRRISIQERLEPGESCTLSLLTKIPTDTLGLKSVTFQFRFQNEEIFVDSMGKPMTTYFGEPLVAYINFETSSSQQASAADQALSEFMQQKPSLVRKPKSDQMQIIDELLAQETLSGTYIDEVLAVGKTDQAVDESYYQTAFDLSDKGFGQFDRCLHIMALCGGNRREAEKILSKLMMKEAKNQER